MELTPEYVQELRDLMRRSSAYGATLQPHTCADIGIALTMLLRQMGEGNAPLPDGGLAASHTPAPIADMDDGD